jgi:antitoxin component of RelBE/YafQ-DinJ toxin-antitoxin module
MTLKQVIMRKAVPFEISTPSISDELEKALRESLLIEKEYKDGKRKGYNNANEMMESILND